MAKDCCNVCGLSLILPNLQHQWSIFVDTTHRHTDSFFILEDTSCPDSGPDLSVENSGIGSEKFLEQLTMSECFPKGSVLAFFFWYLVLVVFSCLLFSNWSQWWSFNEVAGYGGPMQAPGYGAPIQAPQARDFCGASLDGLCLLGSTTVLGVLWLCPSYPLITIRIILIHRTGGAEAETRCLAEMVHGR